MSFWLPALILLAVLFVCWMWERQRDKKPEPSFRPWYVRLLPRQKK